MAVSTNAGPELLDGHAGVLTVIQGALEPMALLDRQGRVRHSNPAMARLLTDGARDVLGTPVWDFAHPRHRAALRACFFTTVTSARLAEEKKLRVTRRDGAEYTLHFRLTHFTDEPAVDGLLLSIRDVGRLAEAEGRLLVEALRDRPTGLPGRAALMDRIARASADGRPCWVLVFEVDGFDSVRGGWGLGTGDHFLVALADRIRSMVGTDDFLARLEGDQLGLLHFGSDEASAVALARAVQAALQRPLLADGRTASCGVRVGISAPSESGKDPRERVRRACLACQARERGGPAGVAFYRSEMAESVNERMAVVVGLRAALDQASALDAHYQPIVDLSSRRIVGFEALMRWRHPQRGLLTAGAFLPHVEESDLIVDLGWWMLDRVCAEVGRRAAAAERVVPVHVNVSPRQVASGELVDRVTDSLQRHACPVELLHLEVTESATELSAGELASALEELRILGVGMSIDDFGTGHSSLSYLHRLPADVLKIDRSFVTGIEPTAKQEPLVRSIVAVARELQMKVIAEGIETELEASSLRDLGCQLGQGYLFSKPLPGEDAFGLLRAGA